MSKQRVVWENPPPSRRERYDWAQIAQDLRDRPGEWMKVFDNDRVSLTQAIRQGSIRALAPSKGFVVSTRHTKRGQPRTCSLYLMYDPEREVRE